MEGNEAKHVLDIDTAISLLTAIDQRETEADGLGADLMRNGSLTCRPASYQMGPSAAVQACAVLLAW